MPAAHIERVLRDYYASGLGDADLEERLLCNVDEGQFRSICQGTLEGLATRQLNLEMLIECRARVQERRVVPETIARFIADASGYAGLPIKPVGSPPHTFEPGHTPARLRPYERAANWRLPPLLNRYPRCTTDPRLQAPIHDSARFPWHEVSKVEYYWLGVDAVTQSITLHENRVPYESPSAFPRATEPRASASGSPSHSACLPHHLHLLWHPSSRTRGRLRRS